MKKLLLTIAMGALSLTAFAQSNDVISVNASNVTCMLSTNCTVTANDWLDDFDLPNSDGDGVFQTRVLRGQPGSPGAGLYTYLYRIDLSDVTADNPNLQGCTTNVVHCRTNEVRYFTNVLVCRTNTTTATNRLICTTNRIPATEFVVCFTNSLPATNIVRCVTNEAGFSMCFTNEIPATNFVSCFTVRLPGSNVVTCTQSNIPASTNIICATNRVRVTTNVYQCVTNTVPCRGATPCIDSFRIKFGPSVSLGVPGSNGMSTGQVFAVTSEGVGTIAPTSFSQTGRVITVHFATPICPGESSVFIGLVSSNAPHEVEAKLHRTDLSNEEVDARAPDLDDAPITCDFSALRAAIQQLGPNDLLAPNDNSREGRRKSLLNAIDEAIKETAKGDADDALDELDEFWDRVKDNDGKWFSSSAAAQLRALADALRDCLKDAEDND